MNTYHVSKQITKRLGKLAFVALSSICLFNTAFTTPALAEAQMNLDTFAQDSLQNAVEVSAANAKAALHTVSQDASTLFAVADPDLSTGSADVSASSEPTPSTPEATNADAIVIEGNTVVIQGDTDTSAIRTVMQSDAGKATNTVLFKNQIAITTKQTHDGNAPFSYAIWLKYVTAAEGARVSFVAGGSASAPTLQSFFYGCSSLESLDGLSAWNVSSVRGTECMFNVFSDCSSLNSLDGLSAWDVSNVNGYSCMASMFAGCSSLTSLDGLYAWDMSSVNGDSCMGAMFAGCSSLTSLNGLSAWDMSNVNGDSCMSGMFRGCSSLTSLDGLAAWNVSNVSNLSSMASMFSGCSSLTSLDGLSAWDVSGVNGESCMGSMFDGCSSLTSLDGLAAWNVSGVSGPHCMSGMFSGCSSLTSLDGLAAWNVSGMNGQECMSYMFYNCISLASIDALSSWDIQTALNSTDSVKYMFGRDDNSTVSSLTVSDTFTLTSDMFKKVTDGSLPPVSWWPVNATTPSAVAMNELATKSQDTANYGYRWQRCTTGTENPMKTITDLNVVWPLTANLTYTGLLQTVTPTVTADGAAIPAGTELKEDSDFSVTYTNNTSGKVTDAIKDAGTYTARVIPRGVYTYTGEEKSTQITIDKLDLSRETNPVRVYTVPSVLTYTGSALTPKTMVRLYLRDDPNPTSTEQDPKPDIPIYTYLVQKTEEAPKGDYSVSYKDNIGPGTATATVSPAIPTGLSASNLEGSASATFRIPGDYTVIFDSNGGSKVDPIEAMNNQTIQEPTAPTKQGLFFAGWYKDNAFKNKWDFAKDTVTSDITLYAKWDKALTVTFNTNGGTTVKTQMIIEGKTAKEPGAPTKEGFSFAGWYSDEALTQAFNFDTPITENLTLYAKWEQAPGPVPPGPTPGPTPSADTDTNLIPITGDTLSPLYPLALLGMALVSLVLVSYRKAARRD